MEYGACVLFLIFLVGFGCWEEKGAEKKLHSAILKLEISERHIFILTDILK